MQTGQRPRRGCFWWVLAMAVALAATYAALRPFLAFGIRRPPQDHLALLNARFAEQAGVPADRRDRPNPAADALARAIEQTYLAHERGLSTKIDRGFSPRWGVSFETSPPSAAERSVLDAAQGAFAALDDLARDPAVYFPLPRGATPQVTLDALLDGHSAIRQLARMNIARLREAMLAGDPAAAHIYAQTLALGRAAGARPSAVARLVAIAIQSAADEEVLRAGRAGKLPPAALSDLAAAAAAPRLPDAAFLVETERQFVLLSLDQSLGWSPLRSINRDAVKNTADDVFDAVGAVLAAPTYPERQARLKAAAPGLAAMVAPSPLLSGLDQTIPDLVLRVQREFDERATVLRVMLAVERHRAAHHDLPATLGNLDPALLPGAPLLPDGSAVPYERTDTPPGYRLGPDPKPSPEAGDGRGGGSGGGGGGGGSGGGGGAGPPVRSESR